MRNAGVWDVLSNLNRKDTCIVLPTLSHALHWWPVIYEAVETRFEGANLIRTKTAIVIGKLHRVLRIWVPYTRDPTMPMDWRKNREGFDLLNLYGMTPPGRI